MSQGSSPLLSKLRPVVIDALSNLAAFNLDKNLKTYAVSGSHVFFEHCNHLLIQALERMSVRRKPGLIAAWHCLFRMPPETAARGFRSVPALFEALNKLIDLYADQIHFYTDTPRLTQAYQQGLKRPESVRTLPLMPLIRSSGELSAAERQRDELRIGYMGEARLEKGYGDLPWLYRHLPGIIAGRRVRLVIQTGSSVFNRAATSSVTEWLGAQPVDPNRPELEFLPEMSPEEYARAYSRLDLSLLLYGAERYRYSSSGIMAEAVGFGVPVLCYNRTSMADLLTEAVGRGLEVGLAIEHLEEAPVAIRLMAEKIAGFQAAMRAFGAWWIPAQSPRNLILQLLNNPGDKNES